MQLVVTDGPGSMARYSRELAARMAVPTLTTDIYMRLEEAFRAPFASLATLKMLRASRRFVHALRSRPGTWHLPNQHLARYGLFLREPYIVTVHDLIRYFDLTRACPFIHRPNRRDRVQLRADTAGIRRAAAIIAVSQATKHDLVSHLGIDDGRVYVVYEGVDLERFRPLLATPFDFPYILFVGSEHPRKNLTALFAAFQALKASGEFPALRIVKVGSPGGAEADFRANTLDGMRRCGLTEDDVRLIGHVSDEELPAYYSGAICLALPSLYEGFGLPALEAMACGCPVIASAAAALPEVVADAGLLVSPYSVDLLTAALRSVLTDEALRARLSAQGIQRAHAFTWDRAARQTEGVYAAVGECLGRSPEQRSSETRQ